ncbi:MAG TPA: tetratricopeptide repeat protein [Myxococcaceae bacterium]|nr:tetratricopeptide repeat protein [Myxococcaceae bacterium]
MLTLTPDLKSAAAALTADDWMLLAQVGKTSTLGDVLSRSTLEEAHTVVLLERLVALGVLSVSRPGAQRSDDGTSPSSSGVDAGRCREGRGTSEARRLPGPDILELDGCDAARQVSEEQRLRAQSSVAAALEAASVSPVPAPEPRRLRGGPEVRAEVSGQHAITFPLGNPAEDAPGCDFQAATLPGVEVSGGRTLRFGPSPVPPIGAMALDGATLAFGTSPVPFEGAVSGGTLHFASSPVPAGGLVSLEGSTLPFGASPVPSDAPTQGGTLHFGRSPVPPLGGVGTGMAGGPAGLHEPSPGRTLHFGPPVATAPAAGATLPFGGPWGADLDASGGGALSPVPIVARLAPHEVTPLPRAGAAIASHEEDAFRTASPQRGDGEPASESPPPPVAQLSADALREAFADTLMSAPRPPELEQFLRAREGAAPASVANPKQEGSEDALLPTETSALLLETEVFDGIGADAPPGAPPPLSPDDAADAPHSVDASVVLAGLSSDRDGLVAELTEAATHGTPTEPPDGDERRAGHSEGLPFTPAPSVHNPGRAKAREAERPAREAKLPPNVYEEVLRLEALAAKGDLFAVFSLPRGATPAEVKKAFHSLSRRLHPDHYFHLGGGAQKARLETVFRRITEAHATLVDPDRRKAWAEANPTLSRPRTPIERPAPRAPDAAQRDEERRGRLARHPYLLKQAQPLIHLQQGKALLSRGEFGEALELLERARVADPQNPEIARLLTSAREGQKVRRAAEEEAQGRRAEAQGRLEEAVACYRRAATLDPSNGAVALQAARMLEREGGDLREARLFAQRAVELRPRDADAQWLLAQILLRSGARKLARAPLEEVLRLQPGHPTARSQLRQLRLGL